MSSNFTEAELKVLLRGWLCLDGGIPKMNYDRLAKVCEFKSKASASTRWSEAKKKLIATFGEDGMNGAAAATGGDGDEDGDATPAKKTPKKRGRKSNAEKAAIAAKKEEDDDEMGSAKKKVKKEEGTGLIEADSDDEA